MNTKIMKVVIIPSYNETLALAEMLSELRIHLQATDAILVMDDSPKPIANQIDSSCKLALVDSLASYYFINHEGKSGRGSAIRRGIEQSLSFFPNLEYVIECDADGSHRPTDIARIKDSDSHSHMLVGSRYLFESQIVGWPISRRIFSRALNIVIPRLLQIKVSDITNGLRRYSVQAARELIREPQMNMGFIYLSEQALIMKKCGLGIAELPIKFVDRTQGTSTVTRREIFASIQGVISLVRHTLKG